MSAWRPLAISWRAVGLALVVIALAIPVNLGFNQFPAPAMWNVLASLLAWGLFVAALRVPWPDALPIKGFSAALGLVVLGVAASTAFFALPVQLAAPAMALLAGAFVLAVHGVAVARGGLSTRGFEIFCWALLLSGFIAALVGLTQYFMPERNLYPWVAPVLEPGRAIGNLRQPNHLASALLWSLVALMALLSMRPRGPLVVLAAGAIAALLVTAIASSASRTGMAGVAILALWGLLDRRLPASARVLAMAQPMVYGVAWAGLSAWATSTGFVFGGDSKVQVGALATNRPELWANTLRLIGEQPWTGVGFGNFNLAWTLTPMANRPQELFDHSHNLELQLLVELGLPLGGLVVALLLATVLRMARQWPHADTPVRAASMLVLLMCSHSQLEYPLWYGYFMLPTAWVVGYALGGRAESAMTIRRPLVFALAGTLMMAASLLAGLDYRRVTPLAAGDVARENWHERVARGRESLLFEHFAEYAAVAARWQPDARLESFALPTRYILDEQLMVPWTLALARAGHEDQARHLAQRIREFEGMAGSRFFDACRRQQLPPPVQCQQPARIVHWSEYIRR